MKNWEYNNELISGYLEPESLEKQAINVFVEKLIDQVTDRGAKECLRETLSRIDQYDLYRGIYNWLNSEHKEG